MYYEFKGTSQYKLFASNLEINVEANDLYCHSSSVSWNVIFCFQCQFCVHGKFSCTLHPSQKLKNYRQSTENRVGANSSGGRFRRPTIAAYELRKRLYRVFIVWHVHLILPFLANTCRHRPISVKSTSTGRSLFAIITSTAQPRSSFQYLNNASALSLTTPLKHCWCYYSLKGFSRFWLAESTRVIHHNQLLMTEFGRIFATNQPMTSKVQLPCRLMHR